MPPGLKKHTVGTRASIQGRWAHHRAGAGAVGKPPPTSLCHLPAHLPHATHCPPRQASALNLLRRGAEASSRSTSGTAVSASFLTRTVEAPSGWGGGDTGGTETRERARWACTPRASSNSCSLDVSPSGGYLSLDAGKGSIWKQQGAADAGVRRHTSVSLQSAGGEGAARAGRRRDGLRAQNQR